MHSTGYPIDLAARLVGTEKDGLRRETDHQLDEALDAFAFRGAAANRGVVAPILSTRGAAAAAKDPRFRSGLATTMELVASGAPGSVEMLATAWRLTSVSAMREHRRDLVRFLEAAILAQPFDGLPTRMSDPEDRRHFADAMRYVRGGWKPRYLAQAIAAERDGDKARESLCRSLLGSVAALGEAVQLLNEAIANERFDQLDPEVGRARRATAAIEGLTNACWTSDAEVPPGEGFGGIVAALATHILLRRPPSDRHIAVQFAAALVGFVVMAVRLHGSLAADAGTFGFVAPMRRAFGPDSWPRPLQLNMERAAGQLLDQLLLLVRLGMPDADLRRSYVALLGGPEARRNLSVDRGLEPAMAHWLERGTAMRTLATQAAIVETASAGADAELAGALREVDALDRLLPRILPELASAAEFHSEDLAAALSQAVDRMARIGSGVGRAARSRGLVLRGSPGEVVGFSPAEHHPTAAAVGNRTVRLLSPLVERIVDGRNAGVVLKADVDEV